jgi:phenylalanyl-tRNA synthetase alpha chain
MIKSTYSNIGSSIESKVGRNLHNLNGHPIQIIKEAIYSYFDEKDHFMKFDDFDPECSVEDNFDKLLIPKGHPARSKSDTYYIDENRVLRTHTSAHQNLLLKKGHRRFLVTGDVYRRDEIDRTHYPVFHQMEGLCVLDTKDENEAVDELKKVLSGLVEFLFPGCEYRYNPDYFPFTTPSFEIEVKFNDNWLEILGCGITHHKILDNYGIENKAWAFGFGLDRLAMILFKIPDIRIMWSESPRFLNQFKTDKKWNDIMFKPFSVVQSTSQDISFFIKSGIIENKEKPNEFEWKDVNDFFEICRELSDDMIEEVKLFDKFYNKKKDMYSHSFRVVFKPIFSVKSEEELFYYSVGYMKKLRELVKTELDVDLR